MQQEQVIKKPFCSVHYYGFSSISFVRESNSFKSIFSKGGKSDTEVTWEDQQNINKFGRLNNRFHELEDEIKIAKV